MNRDGVLAGIVMMMGVLLITSACTVGQAAVVDGEARDVPLKVKSVWIGSFTQDIQPMLDRYCVSCHGSQKAENGLRLDGYVHLMSGTRYGPVIVPGVSSASTIVAVLEGKTSPRIAMPQEGHRLTPNMVTNIKYWIDAGAKED